MTVVPDLAVPDALSMVDLAGQDLTKLDLANADLYVPLFASPVSYATEKGPVYLAVADLNKDNNRDLVVLSTNDPDGSTFGMGNVPASVRVYLGNGDGTFSIGTPVPIPNFTTTSFVTALAVGDVSNDTKPDVLVTVDDGVVVLLGDGSGGLGTPNKFSGGILLSSLAIGDLDGDNKQDVVAADLLSASGFGKALVFLGNGDGTFGTPTSFAVGSEADINAARSPVSVRIGDMNSDGKNDIVTANNTPSATVNTVGILANMSTAGNPSFAAPVEITANKQPNDLLVSQLDGANKLDIVVANATDNSISIFLSDTTSTSLTYNAPARYVVGNNPSAITFGDIDGDTKVDIVASNQNDNTITVVYGGTSGMFNVATASRPGSETYPTGRQPKSIVAATFNSDVKMDVATSNLVDDTISVLINQR